MEILLVHRVETSRVQREEVINAQATNAPWEETASAQVSAKCARSTRRSRRASRVSSQAHPHVPAATAVPVINARATSAHSGAMWSASDSAKCVSIRARRPACSASQRALHHVRVAIAVPLPRAGTRVVEISAPATNAQLEEAPSAMDLAECVSRIPPFLPALSVRRGALHHDKDPIVPSRSASVPAMSASMEATVCAAILAECAGPMPPRLPALCAMRVRLRRVRGVTAANHRHPSASGMNAALVAMPSARGLAESVRSRMSRRVFSVLVHSAPLQQVPIAAPVRPEEREQTELREPPDKSVEPQESRARQVRRAAQRAAAIRRVLFLRVPSALGMNAPSAVIWCVRGRGEFAHFPRCHPASGVFLPLLLPLWDPIAAPPRLLLPQDHKPLLVRHHLLFAPKTPSARVISARTVSAWNV